jgi:predicted nucleic acid-binding protein
MLVVSDASPLNVLIRISLVEVLPALYARVMIPEAVASEMGDPAAPRAVREFINAPPAWLDIQEPRTLLSISGLDRGEQAAISLACQNQSELLLIDEKRGRRAARELNLRIIGTIGILEAAATRNLISLPEALQRIRQTDFFVSDEIIEMAMERDAMRKK